LGRPHVLASTALVVWGCAKANEPDDSYRPDEPAGARAGTTNQSGSGGKAQSGSGGTPSTGGGSAGLTSGGSSGSGPAGGKGGVAGSGGMTAGRGGNGGAGTSGGTNGSGGAGGTGGVNTTAGSAGSGGTSGAGGASGAGGTGGAGGSGGTTGGAASGGTGGVPLDPNFMPPDMTDAKMVVLYQAQSTMASSQDVRFVIRLKNQTEAAYDLGSVTVRYWLSSEPAPQLHVYYSSAGLAAGTPEFVGNMSNSYVEFNFRATGVVPAYVDQNSLNQAEIQFAIDTMINGAKFNQSNDWSFDAMATQSRLNAKITVYDGDTLIFGCEPSQVCATTDPPSSGEAGAAGQSGN
jgi:hypothetical protein